MLEAAAVPMLPVEVAPPLAVRSPRGGATVPLPTPLLLLPTLNLETCQAPGPLLTTAPRPPTNALQHH